MTVVKHLQAQLKMCASASRICRSVEYFFEADKALTGPNLIMFPFHVAFSTICILRERGRLEVEADLEWCRLASRKFGEARLPTLDSLDIGRFANRIQRNEPDAGSTLKYLSVAA